MDWELAYIVIGIISGAYLVLGLLAALKGSGSNMRFWDVFFTVTSGIMATLTFVTFYHLMIEGWMLLLMFVILVVLYFTVQIGFFPWLRRLFKPNSSGGSS